MDFESPQSVISFWSVEGPPKSRYGDCDTPQSVTSFGSLEKRSLISHKCPFGIATCTGCSAKSVCSDDDFDDETEKHKAALWHTTLALANLDRYVVRSPAAYRNQLSGNFISLQNKKVPGLVHRDRVVSILDNWLTPRSDAMSASVDCFLLLSHAMMTRDPEYFVQGQRRHQAALSLLQTALERPGAAHDDAVLGAINSLGACEMFLKISQGEGRWTMHAQALCAILKTRGPKSIQSQFARDVVVNFYHVAVMQALRQRRSFVFDTPEWILYMRSLDSRDQMGELRTLTCELPGALERVDALIRTPGDNADAAIRLITGLSDLDRRFQDWLLRWYKGLDVPYKTVTVTRGFPEFNKCYPQHAELFPIGIQHPSLSVMTAHGYYWAALLVLREAMWDLATATEASALVTHVQKQSFKRGADECADALCQMIPSAFIPDPNVESYTAFTSYFVGPVALCCPLDFTMRWHRKQGEVAKMQHCRNLIANIHMHLISRGLSSPFGKFDQFE